MQRTLLLFLAALGAGCGGLELEPAPEVIHARFDPQTGVVPMPTDVLRDADAGRLALPVDGELSPAERDFYGYLNTLDGWSTATPARVELTGAVDLATVTADTLQVWHWRATPTRVEGLTVRVDGAEHSIVIDPPREGWERGGRYVVLLRGGDDGARGVRGEQVLADAAFYFLRLTQPLDAGDHDRAFPGASAAERRDAAARLEEIRRSLAPFFDFFEDRGVPRAEVAALWSFTVTRRTELAMDRTSQRMPLPIDLLLDPDTGRVDLPATPWDSEVVRAAKASLRDMDGFSLSAELLFGATARLDGSTVSTDTIELVRLGESGGVAETIPIRVRLFDDGKHVAVVPEGGPLAESTRYALLVSDALRDADGEPLALMPAGALLRARGPVFADGVSQVGGVGADSAVRIEAVRAQVAPLLAERDDLLVAWSFRTLSVTEPMAELLAQPETLAVDPEPTVTGDASAAGALLDFPLGVTSVLDVERVFYGTIESPQFLDPVTRGWRGDGGHAVEEIPFIAAVPALSPGERAPVVIFGHGLMIERRYLLALVGALADRGFAAFAVDLPYHGQRSSCYAEDEARLRFDPETGETAPLGVACRGDATCSDDGRCVEPDGSPGELRTLPAIGTPAYSGVTFIEIDQIANTRDHMRQALIDLSALARSLEQGDWERALGVPLDATELHYTGLSLGGILGATFTANHPSVARAVLNVPGANTVALFGESPVFRGRIDALLEREGTERGEFEADKLLAAATWIMDPVDPQSFAHRLTDGRAVLIQMATLDVVIPNPYTEWLTALSGAPQRDYVASHAFIALPLEPEYWRGVNDVADFLAGEDAP